MNLDKRLLRYILELRLSFSLPILLGLAAGALTVVQARLLSQTISQVFLQKFTLEQVLRVLLLLLGVFTLRAIMIWGGESAAGATAVRIKTNLRSTLFRRLQELGPGTLHGERTGELTNTIIEGTEALDAYFSQYLPGLALAALVPLTLLAFILPIDPLTGVILLVTAPLIPLFMYLIGNLAQALNQRQWLSLSRISTFFLDVIQGLTTLKLLGRSRSQVDLIAQVGDNFRQVTMRVLRTTFLSALSLEMLATLSTAIIAVEIGLRLLYGRLTFEQAFFILLLAPEFYQPLRNLGARFHASMTGVSAAERIFEVLDIPVPTLGVVSAKQISNSTSSETHYGPPEICFENVSINYREGCPALNKVSFKIPPGQKTALVGPSGAGKSTIAALLLRFYSTDSGRIIVNGSELEDYRLDNWRAQVAWLPQDHYLFNDTIAANIGLGNPQASREHIIHAARQAHVDEFISSLPKGYDTLIGEQGMRLSRGQAQRVALARAFLKDAPFIIMDEATANLDVEHEALVLDSLEHLMESRTALIIAHRLNTVIQADQIIVIDKGRIIEHGSHKQLIQKDGLYRQMLQSPSELAQNCLANSVTPAREFTQEATRTPPSPAPPWDLAQLKNLPFSSSDLMRLIQLITPLAGWIAISVFFGFATIASNIGLMATSAYIISAAALKPSIAELQIAIVGVRFFGISRGVFRYLERYISHNTTFRLLARLRTWFYRALEPLAPARLLSYRSGDLHARILSDIHSLEGFFVRALAPPITAILVSTAIFIFLTSIDHRLALIQIFYLFVAGICLPVFINMLSRKAGHQEVIRRAQLNASVIDGIQGMADLLSYGQADHHSEHIDLLNKALADTQKRKALIGGLQTALSNMLSNLSMWTILAISIPMVTSGQIDGVLLAVLTLATLTSFESMAPLPQAAQHLGGDLQAFKRLLEIVHIQPEIQEPLQAQPVPKNIDIEAKSLRFRFPNNNMDQPYVINNISFRLPAGNRLAIVGPSGSGKSTLVNLLLRFWEYQEGEIFLCGRSLRNYAQDDLRNAMGVVLQNNYLFSASIRDNIRIAHPGASQAVLESAVRQAQLSEFIESLPEGYNTWIGERGLHLSSGERQRIAIARALLKVPRFLVLDEPTANLDTLTERLILQEILNRMEGQTILLVTHRLVGMDVMDEILVLQAGSIVERGQHSDLLAAGGLYQRMWDLQESSHTQSGIPMY